MADGSRSWGLADGVPPAALDLDDVRGDLVQRHQRRCGLRAADVDRLLDLAEGMGGHGVDERLAGCEATVDRGASDAGGRRDLSQARGRIVAEDALGHFQDRPHGALSVRAQRALSRCLRHLVNSLSVVACRLWMHLLGQSR